jgi:hypothetical protein
MPRLLPLSRETISPRTILVGRSDQEPHRDLAYSVVAVARSGRVLLRRHGRDGFTGYLDNFEEYAAKLAGTIEPVDDVLAGVPTLLRHRVVSGLVAHLNGTWEVSDGRRSPPN